MEKRNKTTTSNKKAESGNVFPVIRLEEDKEEEGSSASWVI
jgi:hypothetical protein